MLELIFKGLLQWLFDMVINITEYLANSLLEIFTMDLAYFEATIPITNDIVQIMTGVGWALLLGNLVFQALKSMASGLGFDGEDPRTLFTRTFVMSFLLVFSREVCDIGLSITNKVMDMLQIPDVVQVPQLTETTFSVPGDASWLLVIIIVIILIVQIIKLFFELGERYVIVAILTILSPLAFAMGGSKNTMDIFKGWVRMFGSMCLMMVLSLIFLKFVLSAMSVVPSGVAVIPWAVFIVAIARVGRKIDNIIARIGLSPAATGDPLGHSRIPGMLSYMVVKNMAKSIQSSSAAEAESGKGTGGITVIAAARPGSSPDAPTSSGASASSRTPDRPPIGSSATGVSGDTARTSMGHPSAASLDAKSAGTGFPAKESGYATAPKPISGGTESGLPGRTVAARPEAPVMASTSKPETGSTTGHAIDGKTEKMHGTPAHHRDPSAIAHDTSLKPTRPTAEGKARHTFTTDGTAKEERPARPATETGKSALHPMTPVKPVTATAEKPGGKVPSREEALRKAGIEKETHPTEKITPAATVPKTPKPGLKGAPTKEPTTARPDNTKEAAIKETSHISAHTHSSTGSATAASHSRPATPGTPASTPQSAYRLSAKPPIVKNANLQKPKAAIPPSPTGTAPTSGLQDNQAESAGQRTDPGQAARTNLQGRSRTTRPPDTNTTGHNNTQSKMTKNNVQDAVAASKNNIQTVNAGSDMSTQRQTQSPQGTEATAGTRTIPYRHSNGKNSSRPQTVPAEQATPRNLNQEIPKGTGQSIALKNKGAARAGNTTKNPGAEPNKKLNQDKEIPKESNQATTAIRNKEIQKKAIPPNKKVHPPREREED